MTRLSWLRSRFHHDARAQAEIAERILMWACVGIMIGGLLMFIVGCAERPLHSFIVETKDGEVHRPVGHYIEAYRGVLCVGRIGVRGGIVECWPLATVKTWRPGER